MKEDDIYFNKKEDILKYIQLKLDNIIEKQYIRVYNDIINGRVMQLVDILLLESSGESHCEFDPRLDHEF